MSFLKILMRIGAFIAGLFVVLTFWKSKDTEEYILLNAENDV